MKLVTNHVFPPIPIRTFDWIAYDDNLGCEEGCPVGYGPTEKEAIEDLCEQLDVCVPGCWACEQESQVTSTEAHK